CTASPSSLRLHYGTVASRAVTGPAKNNAKFIGIDELAGPMTVGQMPRPASLSSLSMLRLLSSCQDFGLRMVAGIILLLFALPLPDWPPLPTFTKHNDYRAWYEQAQRQNVAVADNAAELHPPIFP